MDIYSFKKRGKMQQVHLEGEYGDIYTSAFRKVRQEYQKLKEDYFL
jgi:hypothetical protein